MRTYAPRNASYSAPRATAPRSSAPAWASDPATASQLSYLDSLIEGRDTSALAPTDIDVLDIVMDRMDAKPISKREASRGIDVLKTLPRSSAPAVAPAAPAAAAPADGPVVKDGMYLRPDGVIFKVQASRTGGNLYAKQLADDGGFEYAPGAIRTLTADMRMTLAQAAEWGQRTGQCCVCGRELTKEESVEAGIGPICAGRF